jgi:hypothetical protein
MPPPDDLKHKVEALQSNTFALLQLLGSDDEKRRRFFEILKGITTPAEFRLVELELTAVNTLVTHAKASAETLMEVAKTIGGK